MCRGRATVFLFCLVTVLIADVRALDDSDGRIVNGQIIDISQAPYTIQLRRYGSQICGGTLVTSIHVITAAHCVDKGIQNIYAVGNASTVFDQGIQRKVIDHMIPQEYSRETGMYRDIAVLKLDSPMMGGVIRSLPLCSVPWTAGQKIQVSGWGLVSTSESSSELRTVFVTMIPHEECLARNGMTTHMSDSKECAWDKGKDSCSGDSGGPAVYNRELCGVVSAGYGCGNPLYPGIYTSVYKMLDFIKNAIQTM